MWSLGLALQLKYFHPKLAVDIRLFSKLPLYGLHILWLPIFAITNFKYKAINVKRGAELNND
jgi:hypothetical protein